MGLNKLQIWERNQWLKRLKELKKAKIDLVEENIPEIVNFMSFNIRSQRVSEDCRCYQNEVSCHGNIEDFNCLICSCSNYISNLDEGGCGFGEEKSKGNWYNYEGGRVWDCTNCGIGHSQEYVQDFLKRNISALRTLKTWEDTRKLRL